MSRQIALFLLVGGIAAAVNFSARIVLSLWLPYTAAIVVAYGCGIVVAFLLNRRFVFRQGTESALHQFSWFVAVNLVAMVQTVAISLLMVTYILPALGWHWHAAEVAHAAGIAAPIASSFFGHKHLSFRKRPAPSG